MASSREIATVGGAWSQRFKVQSSKAYSGEPELVRQGQKPPDPLGNVPERCQTEWPQTGGGSQYQASNTWALGP